MTNIEFPLTFSVTLTIIYSSYSKGVSSPRQGPSPPA